MTAFFDLLDHRARETGSLLCVGLDPHPDSLGGGGAQAAEAACRRLIEATVASACAFKVNSAFFEIHGAAGWQALRAVIQSVPPEVPVILDAKRGDIASTAAAYAQAAFETLGAGAVTVSPYLGPDSWVPFLARPEKAIFLLCKTSNPSASALQDLTAEDGEPVYLHVVRQASAAGPAVGFVVGATQPEALARVRAAAPDAWILAPGVGAQGGDLERAVSAGIRADGLGLLLPISRGLAGDPGAEAQRIVERIRAAREKAPGGQEASGLAFDLVSYGCVSFGEFRLRSGETSPIYFDLRRLVSHPALLHRAASELARLLTGLHFDRLAGLPYAGLPIATAVSLRTGTPMIYPRREAKDYGTRAAVEGEFRAGEKVVLIDDVATSGGTKVEAAARLRAAGLQVEDVVVIVDRQGGSEGALSAAGLRLHSVFTLAGLVAAWGQAGTVPAEQLDSVRRMLALANAAP